ncbi:uncharacterized protein LOC129906166 [Episyrphus balteatus]|uniref:uncharacterized protein LOC129906166 n=1 Tax=Episyrphus balteatus TaxID=286459 RepID=UPI002485BEC3|nr:uncharacterized protein LOC129906166 [Episyrphus balteatus]
MLYPKFPRRTLALILFCMVITLGAVGSIFLIYFFNENSTPLFDTPLKSVYVDDKPSQQYRQNLLVDKNNDYKSDQELLSIYSNYVENEQIRIENSTNSILKAAQDFESDRKKQKDVVVSTKKTINSKGLKDASSDTIYIDDFDRPTYSSKSRGELGNIDYFDTILVDHKIVDTKIPSSVEKLSSVQIEEASPSIIYKTRIISESSDSSLANESELKPRINNKRRWDKNKLMKLRKDDDVYDSEIETAGSGSGDFFDDTEVNEVFIKQLNTRPNKKEKLYRKSSKMNNLRRKKKHRVFIRVGDKFVSSSQPLSTMSSEDDIPSNWSYQRNFKKLSSYPTNPTIHYSEPLSPGKKLLVPAMFTNSGSNSPTSPYNDNFQSQLELSEVGATPGVKNSESSSTNLREIAVGSSSSGGENNEAWIETRTRRIMGNVKKSEERSRQLLLCEEAGGGELCRMLFKGHIND